MWLMVGCSCSGVLGKVLKRQAHASQAPTSKKLRAKEIAIGCQNLQVSIRKAPVLWLPALLPMRIKWKAVQQFLIRLKMNLHHEGKLYMQEK